MTTWILIIVLSLLLSAFFSGMEIAYLTSNKLMLELERKQSKLYNHIAGVFLRSPGQYISTILVGNNIALVLYSIFMSMLIQTIIGTESYFVETFISTIIIVFLAEYIPKAIVRANPNFYLKTFSLPIYLFLLIFYPLAKFSTTLSAIILRIFGHKLKGQPQIIGFDKIDLAALVESASDNNNELANENEMKIFQNALDFSELRVRDCMMPRVEIQAVDVDEDIEELVKIFIRTQFSRMPVYRGSIDNIIGYVNSRSLFDHPQNINQILREIIYVPESGLVQRLLGQLIKNHKSMAIVIDEFGGTAGMVTIEDILEEIFGEIEDEHDADYLVEKEVSNKEYIFSGRLEVEHLNNEYNLGIPESDHYDTIAGLILYTSENVPQVGEIIEIGSLTFRILRASSSKISLVHLKIT